MTLTNALKQHIIKLAQNEIAQLAQANFIDNVATDVARVQLAVTQFANDSNINNFYDVIVISDSIVREQFEGTLVLIKHVMHCEASFFCSCVCEWEFVL
jgi:hypothetical protein